MLSQIRSFLISDDGFVLGCRLDLSISDVVCAFSISIEVIVLRAWLDGRSNRWGTVA